MSGNQALVQTAVPSTDVPSNYNSGAISRYDGISVFLLVCLDENRIITYMKNSGLFGHNKLPCSNTLAKNFLYICVIEHRL